MLSDIITPDLFAAALRMATPLALAAIGGTICERSGVVNIALEGIMLIGAFFGTAAVLATGSPWLGVLAAVLAGVAISAVHAVASVNLRTDQVVSGTAINLLALGLTGFLMELWYGHPGTTQPIPTLQPVFQIGALGEGFIGEVWRWINGVFLSHTPIVYLAIIIAIGAQWAMYHTRWGLRLRALGEHPRAVDTAGVSVARGRWMAVLMSGALGGLAGANLSIEQVGVFQEGFTNGRGFIALAANIFGRWTPIGSYLASLLFGFADALQ
ncbi:MAG: ABC transporter permease, partial [Coriobacteriia bacterium]